MARECVVASCDRPHSAKGFCKAHHARSDRGRDMNVPIRDRAGRIVCSASDCNRAHMSQGLCGMHYKRLKKYGDPQITKPALRDDNNKWIYPLTVECSIDSAHRRVHSAWGLAKQYSCIECGVQAMDWAYDGTDPTQLYGTAKRNGASKSFYSRFPEFYMPMCRKCHKGRDGAVMARELAEYRTIKQETGLSFEEIFARAKGE